MKFRLPMPDFQGVAATGTAVVDLTSEVAGKVLESLLLILGGGAFTRAMITGWRLKGDGKTLRQSTGADANTITAYYNRGGNAATELMIDFMAPWGDDPALKCVGALDLAYQLSTINRVTLEVDIAGATTPTLKAWAELSPSEDIPSERPFRWVSLRENRAQIALTAAGETNISSYIPNWLPVEGGSVFRALHFFSANMTDIRVRKDGIDVFKEPVARMQAWQKRAGRSIQANHVAFDPMTDNVIRDRVFDTTRYTQADIDIAKATGRTLPGAGACKNADFFVTMSGAETFWVQTQELIRVEDH